MRWLWVCALLAVGCKKSAPPAATQGSGSGSSVVAVASDAAVADAVVVDAAPTAALVDLFKVVPATLRVSSQVRNKKILPAHLVDRSLQTAWNSLTGELVGTWVDIDLEAHIAELRLTVGHTGKGPKGQDYFTMNPRIVSLTVAVDGKPPTTVTLDPEKRELQVVPVDAKNHVRITVASIKPGTKKNWREIAISELEAWGTPDSGIGPYPKPLVPEVFVGEDVELPPSFCDDIDKLKEEREAQRRESEEKCNERPTQEERDQCNVDPPGDPECSSDEVTVGDVDPPWKKPVVQCMTHDNVYGPTNCTIEVATVSGGGVTAADEEFPGTTELEVTDVKQSELVGGPPMEIEVHYIGGEARSELIVVCRALPSLQCTAPMLPNAAINNTLVFK